MTDGTVSINMRISEQRSRGQLVGAFGEQPCMRGMGEPRGGRRCGGSHVPGRNKRQRQRHEPICLGVIGSEVQGLPLRVWHMHGDANMPGCSGRPECRSIPTWSAEGQKVGGVPQSPVWKVCVELLLLPS